MAAKGLAYAVALSALRGGPIFPAMFLGVVGGPLLARLPGLSVVGAIAMGMVTRGPRLITVGEVSGDEDLETEKQHASDRFPQLPVGAPAVPHGP